MHYTRERIMFVGVVNSIYVNWIAFNYLGRKWINLNWWIFLENEEIDDWDMSFYQLAECALKLNDNLRILKT
jgi:hypothetical protein